MASSSNKKWIIALVAVVALALIGAVVVVCLGAGWFVYQRSASTAPQQITVEVTREVIQLPTQVSTAPTAVNTAAPTLAAPTTAPTGIPGPAAPAANVSYQYLSFWLDPALASGSSPKTVSASPPTQDGASWDVNPEYIQVELTGYLLTDTFHKPAVIVFPAEEYAQMSEAAAEALANTRQVLQYRPAHLATIRNLPVWNAGAVFQARLHYLDFKNGSGFAFLTEFAQNFAPINNTDMFYSFQGLTSDGKYYIAAILPASHPKLIPNADISQEEFQKLADDYQGYLNQIVPLLESASPASFTPKITDLDALIESIEVK